MKCFTRVINPLSADFYGQRASVFMEIEFKNGRLSITGVEGPLSGGNCVGGCGQVRQPLSSYREPTLSKGWDAAFFERFVNIWHNWHLNYMQAGCEHQRALGWASYDEHPSEPCPECGYKYGSAWLKVEVPEDVLSFLYELTETEKAYAWV